MNLAKQSTAKTFLLGPILDADGVAKTDEVVASIKVTKNGSVGAPNGSSTLTHNHTGNYLYAANAGDVDTLGEVEFSLNSGTNAMAPVKFQVVSTAFYASLIDSYSATRGLVNPSLDQRGQEPTQTEQEQKHKDTFDGRALKYVNGYLAKHCTFAPYTDRYLSL